MSQFDDDQERLLDRMVERQRRAWAERGEVGIPLDERGFPLWDDEADEPIKKGAERS